MLDAALMKVLGDQLVFPHRLIYTQDTVERVYYIFLEKAHQLVKIDDANQCKPLLLLSSCEVSFDAIDYLVNDKGYELIYGMDELFRITHESKAVKECNR